MGVEVKRITDPAFGAYGKVITGYELSQLLEKMGETPLPEDVIYVPSDPQLEAVKAAKELAAGVYGGMPIQIGYCNGHNRRLNAVEYHRDAELDIAVDDLVLLLGKEQDIRPDHTYETARMEAFLVPAGTAVLLYETTLHYAPCHTDPAKGFRVMVALPAGTNTAKPALAPRGGDDAWLWACNKWLLAHPDSAEAGQGAAAVLTGVNIDIANDL